MRRFTTGTVPASRVARFGGAFNDNQGDIAYNEDHKFMIRYRPSDQGYKQRTRKRVRKIYFPTATQDHDDFKNVLTKVTSTNESVGYFAERDLPPVPVRAHYARRTGIPGRAPRSPPPPSIDIQPLVKQEDTSNSGSPLRRSVLAGTQGLVQSSRFGSDVEELNNQADVEDNDALSSHADSSPESSRSSSPALSTDVEDLLINLGDVCDYGSPSPPSAHVANPSHGKKFFKNPGTRPLAKKRNSTSADPGPSAKRSRLSVPAAEPCEKNQPSTGAGAGPSVATRMTSGRRKGSAY